MDGCQRLFVILPALTQSAVAQARPAVVVVAGQPGGGKTHIADLVQAVLDRRGGAVRVSRDLYKPAHRHYPGLLATDVRTAGALVRPDTVRWQAAVEAHVSDRRFDAVVESALADSDDFSASSLAYRAAGHRIEVVTVATTEALSQLGIVDASSPKPPTTNGQRPTAKAGRQGRVQGAVCPPATSPPRQQAPEDCDFAIRALRPRDLTVPNQRLVIRRSPCCVQDVGWKFEKHRPVTTRYKECGDPCVRRPRTSLTADAQSSSTRDSRARLSTS